MVCLAISGKFVHTWSVVLQISVQKLSIVLLSPVPSLIPATLLKSRVGLGSSARCVSRSLIERTISEYATHICAQVIQVLYPLGSDDGERGTKLRAILTNFLIITA